MSANSKTEVEVMAPDLVKRMRTNSRSLTRRKRGFFRGRSAWLGSHSHTMLPAKQSSTADLSESRRVINPKEFPRGNGSDAGTVPPNTTSVKSTAERAAHQFRDPERIPGVKPVTYVYPHADECVSVEHRSRFPVIVDIFQQNLQEHSKQSLKHPTKTEYKLKMCGTRLADAQPSILVSHPWNDVKTGLSIMKILCDSHVREQYDSVYMIARFKIYLFLGPSFTYLGRPMGDLNIRITESYVPGSLLVSGDIHDGVSTITCGISFPHIDERKFVLTSAHAFEEANEGDRGDVENEETVDSLPVPNGDEEENEETILFADVEYDLAELMKFENMEEQNQISESGLQAELVQGRADGRVQNSRASVLRPSRVWGANKTNDPNLDWALVEIEESYRWMAGRADGIVHEASGLGDGSRAVRIMTSRGPIHGNVRSIPAFIANSNDASSLCEVWTVFAVDSSVYAGDSGALVIDSLTEELYGYVIATNQFQELYVMPLKSVIRQISEIIAIPNVKPEVFVAVVPTLLAPQNIVEAPELTNHFFQYWPVKKTQKALVVPRVAGMDKSYMKYGKDLKTTEEGIRRPSLQPITEERTQAGSSYKSYPVSKTLRDNISALPEYRDTISNTLSHVSYQTGGPYRRTGTASSTASSYTSRSPSYVSSVSSVGSPLTGFATNSFQNFDPEVTLKIPGRPYPTVSSLAPPPMASDFALGVGPRSSGQKTRPSFTQGSQLQSLGRDVYDGPHQFLQQPSLEVLIMQRAEIPCLPTSLNAKEQGVVLKQANYCLSQCAYNFFAKYQLPIPLRQYERPVEEPRDREWNEWVSLLKLLMDQRNIPARILHNSQVMQFEIILDSSLGIHHGIKHLQDSLVDDRKILQLISASIQVAKMLKDASAMGELDQLYVNTETMIRKHTKEPSAA
ncbi:hypothetical protein V8C37DRAFT_97299 [Trichoderma ceciliae]